MDIVEPFLTSIVETRCPCFASQCHVQGLQHPYFIDLLRSFAEQLPNPTGRSCNLIFSSKDSSREEIQESSINIRYYCNCMTRLGLLKAPLQVYSARSTYTRAKSLRPEATSMGSMNSLVGGSGRIYGSYDLEPVADTRHQVFTLWNGDYISWDYIINGLDVDDLPVAYHEAIESMGLNREEELELAKLLFWFFRKGIVDNLIIVVMGDIMKGDSTQECLAISSGSIRLSSDYDINVYGQCSSMMGVFFEDAFKALFGKDPGYVFDSNLYSSSFMNKIVPVRNPEWYTSERCGRETFYYVNLSPHSREGAQAIQDQHLWATLKVINAILKLSEKGVGTDDEEIVHGHEDVATFARQLEWSEDDVERKIYHKCLNIINMLNNVRLDQHSLVFQSVATSLGLSQWVNHLSVINYKGSETYYTRGAFLDVVLNQQICGGGLRLTPDTYFDSFMENLADFCAHHRKVKYADRMKKAWNKISPFTRDSVEAGEVLEQFLHDGKATEAVLLEAAWDICCSVLLRDPLCLDRVSAYVSPLSRKASPSLANLLGGWSRGFLR